MKNSLCLKTKKMVDRTEHSTTKAHFSWFTVEAIDEYGRSFDKMIAYMRNQKFVWIHPDFRA